jgi:hypothetical protein
VEGTSNLNLGLIYNVFLTKTRRPHGVWLIMLANKCIQVPEVSIQENLLADCLEKVYGHRW